METVWIISGTVAIALLVRYLLRPKYKLPPGPIGWPLVGNALQVDISCPHKTLTKWSEKYGDVFTMSNFGQKSVVLNSFETIYEGLVTQANKFAGRPDSYRNRAIQDFHPDIVVTPLSKEWVFRKKLVLTNLKMYGDNLANLEAISMELISDMVEELKGVARDAPTDIYPIFHKCVTAIVTSILYGTKISEESRELIVKSVDMSLDKLLPSGMYVLLDILPILRVIPNPWHNDLMTAIDHVKSIILPQIAERKAQAELEHPLCLNDGLLAYQKKAQENSDEMPLTDGELYGINSNLLGAGTITTSTTLSGLIAIMVNIPDIQEKMFKEIKSEIGDRAPTLADRKKLHYMEAAILEMLRYSSIVALNVPHATLEDVKVNGYDIPKGTMVLFNLWKMHHDPKYWDNPWEFRPDRYLDDSGEVVQADHINRRRLLAFGASRRVCVGETLARNRLFLMLTSMVQRFKFLPAGPEELPKHDPRDYKAGIVNAPCRYRLKVEIRE